MDIWLLMIIFHAISALVCFASGVAIISPHRAKRYSWLLPMFMASLIGLIVFMIAATMSHWHEITVAERIIFTGLAGLGLYMLYRALHAKKQLRKGKVPGNYIDDIGFTLISLFNGFIIVALIDLGAPGWLVIAGAVLGTVIGGRSITAAKRRYMQSPHTAT